MWYFPLGNFRLVYILSRNAMLQHLKSSFHSIICQVVAYGRIKTKENFKILVPKVVAGAYER